MKPIIELTLKDGSYFVDFVNCIEIFKQFGTTTLQTAYCLPLTFREAKAFLQALNPDHKIKVIK